MTIAPAPPETLQSLEDVDSQVREGIFLLKDACLKYAQHGLNGTEIGKRVRSLGAELADTTARKYVRQFKAEGLLEEKAPAERTQRLHRAQERERQNGELCRIAEEEPIDVEVEVIAPSPSPEEIRAKLNQPPSNPYAPKTNVRRPTEQLRDHRYDSGNESIRGLHEDLLQDSDEPESYKQAARMLREVGRLLEIAKQDEWTEAAFGALRDDAESIARSCAACSGHIRERAHQEAQDQWTNQLLPALRSERGS